MTGRRRDGKVLEVRVSIQAKVCQGHTLCNMNAPEVFGLRDDDGHAQVLLDPVPEQLRAAAELAADSCPERAITIHTEDK